MDDSLLSVITRDLEKAARTYIEMSADLSKAATMVSEVREPEKFRDAADLVKIGGLVPKVVVRGGTLDIFMANLVVFHFVAPVDKKEG